MKKILLAVDGSEHSQRAVELAADIATKYEAKLLILNVIDKSPLNDAERRLAETEFSGKMGRLIADIDRINIDPGGRKGIEPIFARHIEISNLIRTKIGEGILGAAERDAQIKGVKEVELIQGNGDPADVILKTSKQHDANLIVIGSRGQSDFKSLFLGSASHKVANLSEVSVITVK